MILLLRFHRDGKKLDHETDSSSNQADSGCTTTSPASRIPSLEEEEHHHRGSSAAALRHGKRTRNES